jgi:ectoine hydroxylase-related dioxygenase (phytanoyl-CoA dioxygenase family)
MNTNINNEQIEFYQENGFLILDDFLNENELENWRNTVFNSVAKREGVKIPGKAVKVGEADGINADAEYFGKVFDQVINLWQTDKNVKSLILDEEIGKMITQLANVDGIRAWHDQALFKKPWANPTAWHLDTPFWSFSNKQSISIWIALDDATIANGCLWFVPGSHKETKFENYGITKNMDAIFEHYPKFKSVVPIPAELKAGSCTFHNGLTIHGAGPNMTPKSRRAMTCAFMPDGSAFNGNQNILSDEYYESLKIGDILKNEEQNPLIYHKEWK